jgi:hypothetical protein
LPQRIIESELLAAQFEVIGLLYINLASSNTSEIHVVVQLSNQYPLSFSAIWLSERTFHDQSRLGYAHPVGVIKVKAGTNLVSHAATEMAKQSRAKVTIFDWTLAQESGR